MQNPPVSRSTILEAARQRGAARSSRGVLHKPQGNHVIEYSSGTGSSGWRGWACSSGTWPGCGAAEFRRLPRFRGGDSRRASPLRWRIGPPRSRPEGRHTRWTRSENDLRRRLLNLMMDLGDRIAPSVSSSGHRPRRPWLPGFGAVTGRAAGLAPGLLALACGKRQWGCLMPPDAAGPRGVPCAVAGGTAGAV